LLICQLLALTPQVLSFVAIPQRREMLPPRIHESGRQSEADHQQKAEPEKRFGVLLASNAGIAMFCGYSANHLSRLLIRSRQKEVNQSLAATLNFELRARGFSAISNSVGVTGRRVRISIAFRAPQLHCGARGGH
jgi:hypothetical protein